MKNLDGALRLLAGVRGRVELHVYGPKEDPEYWDQCTRIIAALPNNIRVEYHGAVQNDKVPETLATRPFPAADAGRKLRPRVARGFSGRAAGHHQRQNALARLTAKRVGFDLPLEQLTHFKRRFSSLSRGRGPVSTVVGVRPAVWPAGRCGSSVVEANRKLFVSVLAGSATVGPLED